LENGTPILNTNMQKIPRSIALMDLLIIWMTRATNKKKFFQFATIFHHLKQGRLMMNYECM
jgi:hypothetical protein